VPLPFQKSGGMNKIYTCIVVAMIFTSFPEVQERRESVLDRIVNIERDISTEVPTTFCWCDSLTLQRHHINVGDAELFVEEEGKGTPLVLVNGGPGGTHHYFHPWFSRAGGYARVIYYDQRGCGRSDFKPGEFGYSVEQAVDDLDAIRRLLKIDKWIVLGYSYGGFLAQYYTIKYSEHMLGLILLGASPGMRIGMKSSRQSDFLSRDEQQRMDEVRNEIRTLSVENHWTQEKKVAVTIYNLNLNGDWKRQMFYRPSRERIAQMALFEWVHDADFNGILNRSAGTVDLTGAFESCPVPTLILEGKYDLTWNTDKPAILQKNHPRSHLVVFENAGHGIYDEEHEKFFEAVRSFIADLPAISPGDVISFKHSIATKGFLTAWEKSVQDTMEHVIETSGWGRLANEKLASSFHTDWLRRLSKPGLYLKIGFALYDVMRYDDALAVFGSMQTLSERTAEKDYEAVALIWQGQMLDLMDRRTEAIKRYSMVVELNHEGNMRHDQYGLHYSFIPYAKERILSPFKRIENNDDM
jgi:proline iminopeptidase